MGMIILIIFAAYIVVGVFLSKIVFKIFGKKLISRLFLTIFIVFPFWDVLLQDVTAIYYNSVYDEYQIYGKAEVDKDGKVDSIAYLLHADDMKYYTPEQLDKYDSKKFNKVRSHLEFLVKDEKGKERILKVKKIAQGKYDIKVIEKSEARYKIFAENETVSFYHRFGYKKIVDTKYNKTMAESFYLYFEKFDDNFRTNFLYMVGGTGNSIFTRPNNSSKNESTLLKKIGIKDKKWIS